MSETVEHDVGTSVHVRVYYVCKSWLLPLQKVCEWLHRTFSYAAPPDVGSSMKWYCQGFVLLFIAVVVSARKGRLVTQAGYCPERVGKF